MQDITQAFYRVRNRISANRIARIHQHYLALREQIGARGKGEKEELTFFTRKFQEYYKRTRRLARIRILIYLFLYASVTVNVLKAIPLLAFLVGFIEIGSALLGTTLALALLFWITAKINLNLQLMDGCLSHLIALYHKNPKRDTGNALKRLQRAF